MPSSMGNTTSDIDGFSYRFAVSRCSRIFKLHDMNSIAFRFPKRSRKKLPDNAKNLRVKWKHSLHKCVDASPLVLIDDSQETLKGSVLIGSHSHDFYCLDLNLGTVNWKAKLGDRIESSAACDKNANSALVGCYDGKIYAISIKNGEIQWKYQTNGQVKSSGACDEITGFFWIGSHDGFLRAFDPDKFACVAEISTGASIFSSPFIDWKTRSVFCCNNDGEVLCVDADSFGIKWKVLVSQEVKKEPIFSSCACGNGGGDLIVATAGGRIVSLDQSNGKKVGDEQKDETPIKK